MELDFNGVGVVPDENIIPLVEVEENEPLARRLYRNGVKWYRKYYKPNQPNNFTQDTGPQVETESPVAAFSALFPDDLIDMLVYQTNLYATQNVNGPIRNPTNSN